ncbi:MAG TPA: Zn-dependent hydrolase [Bordetella sp.]|nr:Zn-dependent hydrolase [Bordetella sp.]
MNQVRIDADRLWRRVMDLAAFTRADAPWTRRAFGAEFKAARAWLEQAYRAAGLDTHVDAAGNLVGRRPGRRPGLPPLATGSHCDTVAEGGRFDGIAGVLAGLEIAHCMQEDGHVLEHPFEVIDFLSEEPSDYGVSCVGSRAMAGQLGPQHLAQAEPGGETLAQAIDRIGGSSAALASADRRSRPNAAFIELHIEQGPVLEHHGLPIGVVSHIVGIRRVALTVHGRPDHAGTTPMDIRRDALVGAAELIIGARRQAEAYQGQPRYVVATIGHMAITPNAANAVPGSARMTLEVRSDDPAVLRDFPEKLLAACQPRLRALQLGADLADLTEAAPTACSADVMRQIEQAAADLGLASKVLPSGAGHDAAYMAALGPMGMIFVPCRDGRSHCPEEWLEPDQLAHGAQVLYRTLCRLDQALLPA